MDIVQFLLTVHAIVMLHDGSVTSWIRSVKRNNDVGGLKSSYHRLGLAVDVVLDVMKPEQIHSFIYDARRLGLDAIDEGDHIHLEPKS